MEDKTGGTADAVFTGQMCRFPQATPEVYLLKDNLGALGKAGRTGAFTPPSLESL